MRWLVTGAGGQLGHHLVARLRACGEDVVGLSRAALDITEAASVEAALDEYRPNVLINAAAYTAVDTAESDEAAALAVNGVGPGLLAAALAARAGRLIHISTDYVFDGHANRPYEPDDPVAPRTVYGRTKLAGERAVRAALPGRSCVVRTAWLYGGPGPNFVDAMRRLERERATVDVIADQIGSPTWAADLAVGLIALGRATELPLGTLHYVNAGQASWYAFAQAVFDGLGADPQRIHAVGTAEVPRPAPRPAWSVLSTRAWTDVGLAPPRLWPDALAACLRDCGHAGAVQQEP